MKACGSCGASIPDDAASCPNCARQPGAGDGAAVLRRKAEERVRALGTLYMVAGCVALGLVALSFYQVTSGATLEALDKLERNPGPFGPEMIREYRRFVLQPWYLGVTHAFPFLVGVLWIWSGNRLRMLQGRAWGIAGAVLMFLPCAGCCCLNLPLAIYALVTLTRSDAETVLSGKP